MNIFEDNAHRYHEAGIPVIPLKGKIPCIKNWQVWSERVQTEEELDWLIARFPRANIGAVMGLWASALDIDTDNNEVLKAVPYSPFRRKGSKGHVGIYAPSKLLNIGATQSPIELLNHGRQIVLPPSIHPDTGKPYEWIGEESLICANLYADLPELTQHHFDAVLGVCKKAKVTRGKREYHLDGEVSACLSDLGRNNRLTSIAYAMACDSTDETEAVERLLVLDAKEHTVPWFSDKSEPHRGKDPQNTALKFYQRAVRSAEARGAVTSDLIISIPRPALPDSWKLPPKPRGMIRLFQEYCNATSFGNQDALGIGGGIALMAAIASNRYYTEAGTFKVWPNIYVINLAHSGFGKETSQRAITDILDDSGLLGSATYKSGSSIIMGLPEQPHRLDIIDECAMILKAMGSREDYKSDIVDVLSLLYSKSDGYFQGFTSKGDGKNFGACWNPCVNILGSTTPAGFRNSVSKDMAAKGLLPRFLLFWQKEVGEFKEGLNNNIASQLLSEIKRMASIHLSIELQAEEQTNLLNPVQIKRYHPELIPMTDGAQREVVNIQREYFNQGSADPDSFESAFRNRFAQHTCKLALLDALSLGLCEIGVDSVEWAHSVVCWQWETAKELYELATAENDHEKDLKRVLQFIQRKKTVRRNDVVRRFQGIWSQKLDGILTQLVDSDQIIKQIIKKEGSGKAATIYSLKS